MLFHHLDPSCVVHKPKAKRNSSGDILSCCMVHKMCVSHGQQQLSTATHGKPLACGNRISKTRQQTTTLSSREVDETCTYATTCISLCTYTYVRMYTFMCIQLYVYIYVYLNIHTSYIINYYIHKCILIHV